MEIKKTPYTTFEDVPIFYSGVNNIEFEHPEFKASKTYKWGEYYHPDMVIGMPPFGGENKVYVDTRITGWYLLWVSTHLDEWAIGPNDWEACLLAWTPKVKNDTIEKAGYRMFWGLSLAMNNDNCFDSEDEEWLKSWVCSIKCSHVFTSIRKTKYETEKHYLDLINTAPNILKHLIESNRII